MAICPPAWLPIAAIALVITGIDPQAQSPRATALTPQDHIDIQQLYARYTEYMDSGDREGLKTIFTTAGPVIEVIKGNDWLQTQPPLSTCRCRHFTTNVVILATDSGARGTAYL